MGWTYNTQGKIITKWSTNLGGRDNFGDLGVNVGVILKWIINE